MKRTDRKLITLSLFLAVGGVLLASSAAPAQSRLERAATLEVDANLAEAQRVEQSLEKALARVRAERARLEQLRTAQPRAANAAPETEGETFRIVNGVLTFAFPSTGALLKGTSPSDAGSWCTGTLIGSRTFLTANHCVEEDRTPGHYWVFFQNGGIFAVDRISPEIAGYDFPDKDLAVLTLAKGVEGITPAPVNLSAVIAPGTVGTIVGFGRGGGLNEDYGIKRAGRITTAACTRPETSLVCWDFDTSVGLPGENSNTCNADSGGPLFVAADGATAGMVAGVTSGGTRSSCLAGDHSYDVDVRQFATWVRDQAHGDLGVAAPSAFGRVGDTSVRVLGASEQLGTGTVSFRLDVPSEVRRVRISLNGEDTPSNDFNLFVRRNAEASSAASDCAQTGPTQYGFCEVQAAGGDFFSIAVEQAGSAPGVFQLVATLFQGP